MLNFPTSTKHEQKCIVTHGSMGHLDPKQPPTKRKPFSSILSHHFIYKTELILPQELYEIIKDEIMGQMSPAYKRVILPLNALLEGDFFNEYIKRGNVLMLSEGRIGVDNVYSLSEGILTLHLDKESYEKAGIVGKPEGVKGNRGTKPRWIVEINLRLPSMLHGKKGFDRIVYAFKNVLTTPVTWLFCDLGTSVLELDPLNLHFPVTVDVTAEVSQDIRVNMPSLTPPSDVDPLYGHDFEDFGIDVHEWLSLIMLDSPRISPNDKIDPLLCRDIGSGGSTSTAKLVKVTWRGFLTPAWARRIFVRILLAAGDQAWFAYSVLGFAEGWNDECKGCTVLKIPDAPYEYVMWEVS